MRTWPWYTHNAFSLPSAAPLSSGSFIGNFSRFLGEFPSNRWNNIINNGLWIGEGSGKRQRKIVSRLKIELRYRERLYISNYWLFEACDICSIIWPVVALSVVRMKVNFSVVIAVNTIIWIIAKGFLNSSLQIEFQINHFHTRKLNSI